MVVEIETQKEIETKKENNTKMVFSLEASWNQKVVKLSEVFVQVEKLIDVVSLILTSAGISLRAMDPSYVAMVELRLSEKSFQEYSYNGEPTKVRVNLKDFIKILKNFDKDTEKVSLCIDEAGITIHSENTVMTYKPLSEDEEEELSTPNLEATTKVILNTKEIRDTINIMTKIGDYTEIEIKDSDIIFHTSGDLGEYSHSLSRTVYTQARGNEKTIFSIEYLNDIFPTGSTKSKTGLMKIIDDCEMNFFGSCMPLEITFHLWSDSMLHYFLAPRVEEEDEYSNEYDDEHSEVEKFHELTDPDQNERKFKIESPAEKPAPPTPTEKLTYGQFARQHPGTAP